MKLKLIIPLLLLCSIQATAQKNRFQVGVGGYHFYNVITSHDRILSTINLNYERKLTDKISLSIGYTRMPFYFNGSNSNMSNKYRPITTEALDTDTNSLGKLHNRYNFNFYDIGISYNIISKNRHAFQVRIGASLANGINAYKTNLAFSPPSPEGWNDVVYLKKDFRRETHIGGLLGISYSYDIYKDKIIIGGYTNARFYNKGFPFQINYGLHLGYKF